MDNFRDYYIDTIIPQLKNFEKERKLLEKQIFLILILTLIVLVPIVLYLIIRTVNLNFGYLLVLIPAPVSFLLKKRINKYSKKYKETVIKGFFLSYFESYSIEPELQLKMADAIKIGLLPFYKNFDIKSEDFITVKNKKDTITIHELLVKEHIGRSSIVIFKGLLCSVKINKPNNQNVVFRNHETIEIVDNDLNGYSKTNEKDITIYYKENFEFDYYRPYIELARNERISISIINNMIYFLIGCNDVTYNDNLELFDPALTFRYNSNYTYKVIRNEYFRIMRISKVILKLDELNVA